MRAIWTGALSFGLVNIPIKLYSASEDSSLSFNLLHKTDLSPIKYARVCKSDGKEVPWEEIVKGYEYEKGDWVVLADEDFKSANVKAASTVDIQDFTDEKEIDSIYFEKPYWLEPIKGAEKPYALLREALRKSKKVAVAKFVMRNREHLGVVKPEGDVLSLVQLRFAEEVRSPEELNIPGSEVTNKEIDMALKLIEQLTGHFKPEDYKDTYTADLKAIIEDKRKGRKVKAKGSAPVPTKVPDLMAALKKSLEKAKV